MVQKITRYLQIIWSFLLSLRDIRRLGMVLFLIVVLMITWSGVRVIETNYRLQRSIAQLEQENQVRELENKNLELENQYFESDEYLELEARKNFGLAAPGETVIVVPKRVALNHTVPEPTEETPVSSEILPEWRQNVNAWLDFLLHRTDQS